jgi:hypothetical protein
MEGKGTMSPLCFALGEVLCSWQRARIVERRKAKRRSIQVEIDIAHPGLGRCRGYAENISRKGVSVAIVEGKLPSTQRSVVLNFRVWTGKETLYRKVYARIARRQHRVVAFEFAEHDFITEAIVQDLMFYQSRERRCHAGIDGEEAVAPHQRTPAQPDQ